MFASRIACRLPQGSLGSSSGLHSLRHFFSGSTSVGVDSLIQGPCQAYCWCCKCRRRKKFCFSIPVDCYQRPLCMHFVEIDYLVYKVKGRLLTISQTTVDATNASFFVLGLNKKVTPRIRFFHCGAVFPLRIDFFHQLASILYSF